MRNELLLFFEIRHHSQDNSSLRKKDRLPCIQHLLIRFIKTDDPVRNKRRQGTPAQLTDCKHPDHSFRKFLHFASLHSTDFIFR